MQIVVKAILSVVFVLLGGVFSGLSLGLMGLDSMNLQVLAASGPPADRKDAQRVLGLLSHGRHFVLVCLLLSNVIVNETLPVCLDSLTGGGGWIAVVVSSASIVIFGEVVPQALCSQHGLRIGAKCTAFVRLLMYLEAPICWPAAKLLDLLLGSHTTHFYRREELRTLLDLHATQASAKSSDPNGVTLSEVESEMLGNVLHLESVAIEECGSRIDKVYTATDGMRLCDIGLTQLLETGQRYVPIRSAPSYAEREKAATGKLIGYVTVREVITALRVNPNELVRALPLRAFVQVALTTPAIECIAYLKREDPAAVLALVNLTSSDTEDTICFATLEDLSRLITLSPPVISRERSASLGATARVSLSRPPRPSSSLGLQRFVQGLVERHFTHRASSSQMSFRLSTSSSDADHDDCDPRLSRTRSTSTYLPLHRSRPREPGLTGRLDSPSFRFPLLADPSPIMNSEEPFAIGGDESDASEVMSMTAKVG